MAKAGSSNFPSKKKVRDHEKDLGSFTGKVLVRDSRNPICIPVNSSKTVLDWAPKVNRKKSFMVESADMSVTGGNWGMPFLCTPIVLI